MTDDFQFHDFDVTSGVTNAIWEKIMQQYFIASLQKKFIFSEETDENIVACLCKKAFVTH